MKFSKKEIVFAFIGMFAMLGLSVVKKTGRLFYNLIGRKIIQ